MKCFKTLARGRTQQHRQDKNAAVVLLALQPLMSEVMSLDASLHIGLSSHEFHTSADASSAKATMDQTGVRGCCWIFRCGVSICRPGILILANCSYSPQLSSSFRQLLEKMLDEGPQYCCCHVKTSPLANSCDRGLGNGPCTITQSKLQASLRTHNTIAIYY